MSCYFVIMISYLNTISSMYQSSENFAMDMFIGGDMNSLYHIKTQKKFIIDMVYISTYESCGMY